MYSKSSYITERQSELISLLRVLSILLIVSCHITQGLSNHWAWVLNVGVQIFFCISAFLYGKKEIDHPVNWFKNRGVKILIPYYIYFIIVSVLIFLLAPEEFSWKAEVSHLLLIQGVSGGYNCVNHLWFITWILACYSITPVLQTINKKVGYSLFLFAFSLLALSFISVRSTYLFLYCVVYLISKNGIENDRLLQGFCLTTSIITLLFFSWDKVSDMSSLYSTVFHLVIGFAVFLLVLNIKNSAIIKAISKNKVIDFIDNYSYEIYLTHHIVIIGSFSLLLLSEHLSISVLIIFAVIIFQSILLKMMSSQIQKTKWLKLK